MIKVNTSSYIQALPNRWYRVQDEDAKCIGRILQNQPTQATPGNFYISNKEPSRSTDALLLAPNDRLLEDIMPGQEQLWVMTDTAGAALTIWSKYQS